MDVTQITDALDRAFNDEHVRIVFWNDPDGEFVKSLPDIALEGVEIVNLDEVGALEIKVRIEQDDPAGAVSAVLACRGTGLRRRLATGHTVVRSQLSGRSRHDHSAGTRLGSPASPAASWKAPKVFDSKERLHKLEASSFPKTLNSTSTARCWRSSRKPTNPSYSISPNAVPLDDRG